jgi:hypothetical protein
MATGAAKVAPNGDGAETPVTLTARFAITVTFPEAVIPTAAEPKSNGLVSKTAVVGRPKPIS